MAFAAADDDGKIRHAAPALCAPGPAGPGHRRHAARRDPRLLSGGRDVFASRSRRRTRGPIAFYEAYGFAQAGRTANCGGGQSGIPALVMERPLAAAQIRDRARHCGHRLTRSVASARPDGGTTSRRSSRCWPPTRSAAMATRPTPDALPDYVARLSADRRQPQRYALCRRARRRGRRHLPDDADHVAARTRQQEPDGRGGADPRRHAGQGDRRGDDALCDRTGAERPAPRLVQLTSNKAQARTRIVSTSGSASCRAMPASR